MCIIFVGFFFKEEEVVGGGQNMFQFSILKFYLSSQLNLWRVQPTMNTASSTDWNSIRGTNLCFTLEEKIWYLSQIPKRGRLGLKLSHFLSVYYGVSNAKLELKERKYIPAFLCMTKHYEYIYISVSLSLSLSLPHMCLCCIHIHILANTLYVPDWIVIIWN